VETKVCIKCEEEKELSSFPVRSNGRHRGECYSCTAKWQREYRASNPVEIAATKAKRSYGLDRGQFDLIMTKSNCDLCNRAFTTNKTKHIDHCHETGVVRGLLCSQCNVGLGMFGDSPEKLRKAVEYLNKERGVR
jgi:Zn-finger nucleic acid-binding protein